jgi:Spy/CpxP family protein refolding chaperone
MKIFRKLALLAVCALATAACAQQDTPPPQGGAEGQGHRRGMPSAEDQVKNLTERLNLTK